MRKVGFDQRCFTVLYHYFFTQTPCTPGSFHSSTSNAAPYALGTRTKLWFGHGCSCHRILLEHQRNYGLGMDVLVTLSCWNTNEIMVWAWMFLSPYPLGTPTKLWFGHGCSCHRILLEHQRNYGLGMDVLVTLSCWNTNEIMVWAWMFLSPYPLGTPTKLWFGHGCSGHCKLLEHKRNYSSGANALFTICFWNTNGKSLGID